MLKELCLECSLSRNGSGSEIKRLDDSFTEKHALSRNFRISNCLNLCFSTELCEALHVGDFGLVWSTHLGIKNYINYINRLAALQTAAEQVYHYDQKSQIWSWLVLSCMCRGKPGRLLESYSLAFLVSPFSQDDSDTSRRLVTTPPARRSLMSPSKHVGGPIKHQF